MCFESQSTIVVEASFITLTTIPLSYSLQLAFWAVRAIKRRYDLVYVHNMPDILVLCSLVPKAIRAKVILDMHDPMPELMTTIFNLDKDRLSVRAHAWRLRKVVHGP